MLSFYPEVDILTVTYSWPFSHVNGPGTIKTLMHYIIHIILANKLNCVILSIQTIHRIEGEGETSADK